MSELASGAPGVDPVDAAVWGRAMRRDDRALGELAEEWEGLYRRCPSATPFQSTGWLDAWWRAYGRPGALRVVLVRRDRSLVAAGAFWRDRLGVLRPVGSGVSDWLDVLADPGCEARALVELSDALLAEPGWRVLDLAELRPDASALRLARHWSGTACLMPASVCHEMSATPLTEQTAGLSSSVRQSVRRSLRKIDGSGLREVGVDSAEVPVAVDRLLRLHRQQWRARGGMTPEHGRPRFRELLGGAGPAMARRGQAALVEYHLEGRHVASSWLMIGHDTVGGYLFGARPELFARFNVTTMLLRTGLDLAARHRAGTFSMLRGREAYKSAWRTVEVRNQRLVLGRPGRWEAGGYAGVLRVRAGLLDRLRTDAPALRELAHRARALLRNPTLLLPGRTRPAAPGR
jgi:hypothetical protein